ncbi:GlsB/YeaQ/YmgE family stress response membrane protein [Cereibacter sphaeroides]|uniref:GlsB/YeaQ/YmgE family stress response membrane protein n=1 Tax=Cereibacter sphaeroides TaxID=1063 RepID=UPI001F3F1ED9
MARAIRFPIWRQNRPHDGTTGVGAVFARLTLSGGLPLSIIWTILIGFFAGLIAKFLHPGDNEPSGFILTTVLGIAGAFLATWLGQAVGWYRPGEGAGFIGAILGAIIVLMIWGALSRRRG